MMRSACLALLFLLLNQPALSQTAPPRVEASYVLDERDPSAERVLEELKRHIERRALPLLASGQELSVALMSLHLAGQKSWTHGHNGVRVISDGTPVRIELAFRLTDSANGVVSQGTRLLRSPGYFVADRGNDPLRFEKELLDDWLSREFAAPKSRPTS
jgi:hypothetical protein